MGPFWVHGTVSDLQNVPTGDVVRVGRDFGLSFLGVDEQVFISQSFPNRIWRPRFSHTPVFKSQAPDDIWSMVGVAAHALGDNEYAKLARCLSISLRAAGLHLRSLSDEYHWQLNAALDRQQAVGRKFGDISQMDLHLACHALAAEMGSTRDYLAQVAARRVTAPEKIDSLARLRKWSNKSANHLARQDELVAALIQHSDPKSNDPWLHDIGEYRNRFLHRDPLLMEEGARFLILKEHSLPHASVRTINMEIKVRIDAEETSDALVRFGDLYGRLCGLADWTVKFAKYEPKILVVQGGPVEDIEWLKKNGFTRRTE